MKRIGTIAGIEYFIPSDASLSFFNSPYIGHANQTALDIYPSNTEWIGPAYAPVSGTIARIEKIKMGRKKDFETSDSDYAIGIIPHDETGIIFRILHCQPNVDIGQAVEVGDEIGFLIRSRYFNFWTGPHYHLEAMSSKDFFRSSQSIRPDSLLLSSGNLSRVPGCSIFESQWEIQLITADYMLLASKDSEYGSMSGFMGHLASDSISVGILDAGFPHYPHGGVHGISSLVKQEISIGTELIGNGMQAFDNTVFFKHPRERTISIESVAVRGLSTYLYSTSNSRLRKPPLKVVPLEYSSLNATFSEGDHVQVEIT
ncbi:MAG: hypothetical protein ACFFDR_06755 [Candidatus Thorarchaeota archaeon]